MERAPIRDLRIAAPSAAPGGIAVDMHLADIWSWQASLSCGRDGRVKRTITSKKAVPKRELREIAAPVRVTFHR